MDRLGFWGSWTHLACDKLTRFQYPLMDRLGFWGQCQWILHAGIWRFQYPLMDRLGFWGCGVKRMVGCAGHFSIR